MFTSEPSLAQRIERMIGDLPVIDSFAHVSINRPTAASLAELLADPEVQLELHGVGMPLTGSEVDPPNEPTPATMIPFLKRIRNTSTAWCLYRILRDLYDFLDPDLETSNLSELERKISQASAQPDWVISAVSQQAKLASIMTVPLDADLVGDDTQPQQIVRILDATRLVNPFRSATTRETDGSGPYQDELVGLLGNRPRNAEDLRKLVFDWLDHSLTPSIKCCHLSIPADFALSSPGESDLSAILSHAGRGQASTAIENQVVAGVVGRHILAWSHEQNRAVQVMLTGATTSVGPRWAYQWFEPLRTYSHARIAFMAQSPTSVPGAILLARTFPNAFLMSSWSELHVPTVIERDLAIMIQSVPMTKIVGFASGASSIEWVYARLQLAKKAMAGALAGPVDHRYYEEDEIPTILKQILLDTPKELFGISAG